MGHFENNEEMMNKKDIGLKIRLLRKRAGIETQEALGKKLKPRRAKGTINKIETGHGNYSIDILFDIAKVLDCDISEFFSEKAKSASDSFIEKFLKEFQKETIKEYELHKPNKGD